MSVTFSVRNEATDYEDLKAFLNLANVNARDLLALLGVATDPSGYDLCGSMRAKELLRRCVAARALVGADRGRLGYAEAREGRAALVVGCRPAGRMAEYVEKLVALCDRAGDLGVICWS